MVQYLTIKSARKSKAIAWKLINISTLPMHLFKYLEDMYVRVNFYRLSFVFNKIDLKWFMGSN